MMTTISAGAAAGLLVALMVVATSDSRGAELPTTVKTGLGDSHPGDVRGFIPLPTLSVDAARSAR